MPPTPTTTPAPRSPPPTWAARRYDLHCWTDMPRGGHPAALEQSELLVEDLRAFFRDLR